MARPISMKIVKTDEIPGTENVETVLLGRVRGTGKIPSVGVEHVGKDVYVVVKKVSK